VAPLRRSIRGVGDVDGDAAGEVRDGDVVVVVVAGVVDVDVDVGVVLSRRGVRGLRGRGRVRREGGPILQGGIDSPTSFEIKGFAI